MFKGWETMVKELLMEKEKQSWKHCCEGQEFNCSEFFHRGELVFFSEGSRMMDFSQTLSQLYPKTEIINVPI
jgi:hypothetical protein